MEGKTIKTYLLFSDRDRLLEEYPDDTFKQGRGGERSFVGPIGPTFIRAVGREKLRWIQAVWKVDLGTFGANVVKVAQEFGEFRVGLVAHLQEN